MKVSVEHGVFLQSVCFGFFFVLFCSYILMNVFTQAGCCRKQIPITAAVLLKSEGHKQDGEME